MQSKEFICPHCHSDNIQRFEMVYRNGVSTNTQSTIGMGYSGGGGFGIGTATSSGVSVSNLSQSVAPPQKQSYLRNIILGILAVCVLQIVCQAVIGRVFGGLISWVAFAGMIYWIYKNVYCWNRDVYPKLLNQWYNSYLCLKCGHRFIL